MESNYARQAEAARELFLRCDPARQAEKYALERDGEYLSLRFTGRDFRISCTDGRVYRRADGGEWTACEDFDAVMTLYDAIAYPKTRPALSGEWCTLANLQAVTSPDAGRFNQKYADRFSGRTESLWEACREIGGRQPAVRAGADVFWQFDVLPFFPLQMRFWDSDEEFPAKLQFFWDKASLNFMHFETLYYLMGYVLREIGQRMPDRR